MGDLLSSWYNAIGAVALPGLAVSHLEDIEREFESVVPKSSDGRRRSFVRSAISRLPSFAKVLERSDMKSEIEAVIGRELVPISGDATRYLGETFWHADIRSLSIPI